MSQSTSHIDSRIAEAAALREEGNALWHAGNVTGAMQKYHYCLNYLNGLDRSKALNSAFGGGLGAESSSSMSAEQGEKWRALFVAANLNLAAGLVKREKWERCVEVCSTALEVEPGSVKALLRRAKAFLQLKDSAKAKADLDAIQASHPNEPDVPALRRELAQQDAVHAAEEARMWKDAFSRARVE